MHVAPIGKNDGAAAVIERVQRIRDDEVGHSIRADDVDIGRRGQNRLDPIGETGIADQQFDGNDAGLLQAEALSAIVSVADAGLPARISENSAGRPMESGPSFPKTPRTLPIGSLSQAVMTSPSRIPARCPGPAGSTLTTISARDSDSESDCL